MPASNRQRRLLTYGSNTILTSLLFLGILGFIALIAERHPVRIDLTDSGKYTISEQTRNVLKSLEKPVHIKAFCATASPEQTKVQDLMDTYRYVTKMISYEFIDPDRQPEVARQYEVRAYGTIVLEGYGRKQSTQSLDEEGLTNAILKLVRSEQKKIYFLVGHGERSYMDSGKDGYSNVKEAIGKENYSTAELNLLQQSKVPDDAAILVIAGPQKPLMKQEAESLRTYVEQDGKLMILLDPHRDGGLRDFLKSCGIQLSEDVIIDKLSRVFGGSYLMPVVTNYGQHKIVEGFGIATFFPEARSVQKAKETPKGVETVILASTSENAWGEKNLELLKQGQAGFDEKDDLPGPVPVVVLAEIDPREMKGSSEKAKAQPQKDLVKAEEEKKAGQEKRSYVLVVGDSDFISNSNFSLSGNGDFFLNMVNFLAEEETLITIERRDKGGKPLLLSQGQARAMFWVVLVLIPILVLIAGFSVYRARRTQR
ncbi:MAG: hypothetical protein GX443_02895 [Deltaproteobacteria bacterium]|nr:hypothetical protein [Deltaproteobacteria bacterium]